MVGWDVVARDLGLMALLEDWLFRSTRATITWLAMSEDTNSRNRMLSLRVLDWWPYSSSSVFIVIEVKLVNLFVNCTPRGCDSPTKGNRSEL